MLLLLMYLSPFLAAALFWRSQRAVAAFDAAASLDGVETTALSRALAAGSALRADLGRPLAVAVAVLIALAAASNGLAATIALLAGIALGSVAPWVAASSPAVDSSASGLELLRAWSESSANAQALSALAAGAVGALAWFFADPSGAIVLASFALGAASTALFSDSAAWTDGVRGSLPRSDAGHAAAALAAASRPLHSHLVALAAALMIAATAQPDSFLGLGGLLAESETLRSDLLLLPIALTVLSPLVAAATSPIVAALIEPRGLSAYFDAERIAAALLTVSLVILVAATGLSWSIVGAFVAGIAARQLELVFDDKSSRSRIARRYDPTVGPVVVAGVAFLVADRIAGGYGSALAALGMTTAYATAVASRSALDAASARSAAADTRTDTTTDVTVTLAALAAVAPVVVADSIRDGRIFSTFDVAAPALLVAALVGAAAAALVAAAGARSVSERDGNVDPGAEDQRRAAGAVVAAASLPVVAGVLLGAGGAVGLTLGFAAGAVMTTVRLFEQTSTDDSALRTGPRVLLSWTRTMALATLVTASLMN